MRSYLKNYKAFLDNAIDLFQGNISLFMDVLSKNSSLGDIDLLYFEKTFTTLYNKTFGLKPDPNTAKLSFNIGSLDHYVNAFYVFDLIKEFYDALPINKCNLYKKSFDIPDEKYEINIGKENYFEIINENNQITITYEKGDKGFIRIMDNDFTIFDGMLLMKLLENKIFEKCKKTRKIVIYYRKECGINVPVKIGDFNLMKLEDKKNEKVILDIKDEYYKKILETKIDLVLKNIFPICFLSVEENEFLLEEDLFGKIYENTDIIGDVLVSYDNIVANEIMSSYFCEIIKKPTTFTFKETLFRDLINPADFILSYNEKPTYLFTLDLEYSEETLTKLNKEKDTDSKTIYNLINKLLKKNGYTNVSKPYKINKNHNPNSFIRIL